MSKLSKYTLNLNGLDVGVHEYEFRLNDSFFALFDQSEVKKGNADVKLTLTKQSNMYTLDFDITGEVEVQCDRCLDDFMIPVDYEGTLWVKFSQEEKESDGDVIWIRPQEGELNIAQYIYESIILSLPYQRIHPEDENGNSGCDPKMLEKFRIVSQEEFDELFDADDEGDEEPEEGSDKTWKKQIAKLKDKMSGDKE